MTINVDKFITRPAWVRFTAGLSFVVLAVLITHGLWLVVDRPFSSPVFLTAMVLSSWLLGFRVGIVTAIVSGVAMKYFFVVPYHQMVGDRRDMVRIAVFVITGIILSYLMERLRIASDKIKRSREELRSLTEHQRSVREEEQKRIALEIHDELGQVLTGLKMDIHFLSRQITAADSALSKNEISKGLDDLSSVVDGTINSVRRIASELRPPILDDFGLVAALEWEAKEFERKTKIPCFFQCGIDRIDFGSESNTAIFRIFQETLTNIARHAGAEKVSVSFQRNKGEMVLTVTDDGRGIDACTVKEKRSLGILGMEERSRLIGADLKIGPATGGGTSVILKIPSRTSALPSRLEIEVCP